MSTPSSKAAPLHAQPPRLLLGAALLFWGAMCDRALAGLMLALLVESAHWTRLRWDFQDSALTRAWQLSVLAITLTATMVWLDGNPYTAMPRLLGWLPPLLLPIQFVQSFGLRSTVPLNMFSFFARQRRARNRRLGLQESVVHFNFGYAYLVIALVSSTLGRNADSPVFLPGLILLTGWALISTKRGGIVPLLAALVVAGGIAVAGQYTLRQAYDWFSDGSGGGREDTLNPNHYRTSIGRLGEIKQSPKIVWRVRPQENTPPPTHLRTAGYNRYFRGSWENLMPPEKQKDDLDFEDLTTMELVQGEAYYLLRADADATAMRRELPRFKLRGAAGPNSPLPLPGSASSLGGFLLDGIERNSLGTVRIFPRDPVIDGTVLWRSGTNPETPPFLPVDLTVPTSEEAVIRRIADELGLADEPTLEGKLGILSAFFLDFQYSRYLTIRPPSYLEANTAIGTFLTTERRGHCEYFATAATLLLREAGVPTRYAIGFAVMERDAKRGEFVVRGIHGHAWCRVWNEKNGQWQDYDPTPPNWLAAETRGESASQWLVDFIQRLREDFFIWRGQPGNRLGVSLAMFGIGGAGLVFIIRRLWRSRSRIEAKAARPYWHGETLRTPLHQLGKQAEKKLGPRPVGQPFAGWLAGLRSSLPEPAILDEALRLHQRQRFDPSPPDDSGGRLADLTQALEKALRKS